MGTEDNKQTSRGRLHRSYLSLGYKIEKEDNLSSLLLSGGYKKARSKEGVDGCLREEVVGWTVAYLRWEAAETDNSEDSLFFTPSVRQWGLH